MTIGRKSLKLILVGLYVGAVWARLGSLGAFEYPYFKGESGTNFRYMREIADAGSLTPTDTQASQPEGFSPSRARPTGIEYSAGFVYRLVRSFSDVPERRFAGVLTALVSSLCVFTFFALARMLWSCQAAGVLAAFLAAFHSPLVAVTDGREFLHGPYALVLISLHLATVIWCASTPSLWAAVIAGLAGFALLGSWGSAFMYLAVATLAILVYPGFSTAGRRKIVAAHIAALVLAVIAFPHLRSGVNSLSGPAAYWFSRLRFVSGKPLDPSALSDAVRLSWTAEHAPPGFAVVLVFFLPLVILAFPAIGALRKLRREKPWPPWVPLAAIAIGLAAFLLDGRAVFAASLVSYPLVAGAFKGFSEHVKARVLPAALAAAFVLASVPPGRSSIDSISLAASRLGLSHWSSEGFTWVSIGNADRELVRYLVTRTSTRSDVILAPPDISSVIAGFAGRSTVVAPGIFTAEMSAKIVQTLASFYGREADLFDRCQTFGATYVVYSIDILLDGSLYAPRYLSRAKGPVENTLAYKMHFEPETLHRFQLVYENDNYRLFRVTTEPEPVFLSDHPPVYQEDVLRMCGNDIAGFYSRIIDVLTTYQSAVEAQSRGDDLGAIPRLRYCLGIAPRYTAARNGLGDSLLRLGRPGDAYGAYKRVLQYAPDDKHALYFGALSLAYIGRRGEALGLLELLLSATAEKESRAQALDLKAAIEAGRRIEMPRGSSNGPSK
jgi:hypothetical protein